MTRHKGPPAYKRNHVRWVVILTLFLIPAACFMVSLAKQWTWVTVPLALYFIIGLMVGLLENSKTSNW